MLFALPAGVHSTPPAAQQANLVVSIAERDRTAFARLFQEYAPRIKGYMMRSVRDQGRSDELTQEVLLRVWRRAHTYDPGRGSVSTWIFTMARSVMIDAMRKRSRREPHPDDEAFVPAAAPLPDVATEARRRQTTVQSALQELPGDQASILQAAYFEGKSLSTIAQEQDVPLGTVKSRVRLAFKRLRTVLDGEDSL